MKKLSFTITDLTAPVRLDHLLKERLSAQLKVALSQAKIRRLIMAGRVFINYRLIKIPSILVNNSMHIDVKVDLDRLLDDGRSHDRAFVITPAVILWEDKYLIVINKPAGLPTQPTLDRSRDNLFAMVKDYLARRDKLTDPYLAIHQRLDRDTSGVIVFVKDESANAGMANMFAHREITKYYYAIVHRVSDQVVPQNWEIKNNLAALKDQPGKQSKFSGKQSEGSFAHTKFKVITAFQNNLLIEAHPLTGRTHQIRVHLAEYGLPIVGDTLYHAEKKVPVKPTATRLMLHAYRLIFSHPINNSNLTITAPLPADFQALLNQLKQTMVQ